MKSGNSSSSATRDSGLQNHARVGLTLIEVLVTLSIISVLIGLLLPAVQAAREAARRMQCSSNLKQIGLGLHAYHIAHASFPPGHIADLESGEDGRSWGWGALLLPFVEQAPLASKLRTSTRSFDSVASDPSTARFLQTNVELYRCPSDPGNGRSHRFRSIQISIPATVATEPQATGMMPHISIPPRGDGSLISSAVRVAKSNYIGSFGSQWKAQRASWSRFDFEGSGLFGRNSDVSHSMIFDGVSSTIAIGERSIQNYAAVWVGGNSWQGCGFADNQMVLGTTFYPINDPPLSLNLDCDGQGSANFSSYHEAGSHFLFADGSVHFLTEQIDRDLLRKLADRDDGETVAHF